MKKTIPEFDPITASSVFVCARRKVYYYCTKFFSKNFFLFIYSSQHFKTIN